MIDFSCLDRADVDVPPAARNRWIGYAKQENARAKRRGWKHVLGVYWAGSKERGLVGQLAVSLSLGIEPHYNPNSFKRGGDVGGYYEVRTPNEYPGRLVVRPGDPLERPYILAVPLDGGKMLRWRIWGWYWGHEAVKHPEWKDAPRGLPPAWFVPAGCLNPMRTLPPRPEVPE